MIQWKTLLVCFVLVFATAFLGSLFTENTQSSWYLENKPSFTPPNWVFGPVWTLLYTLTAISLYLAWTYSKNHKPLLWGYGINLAANAFWSYLFFGRQQPFLAFLDLLLILGSLVVLIRMNYSIHKMASWLLFPYLIWVLFAGILNLAFI